MFSFKKASKHKQLLPCTVINSILVHMSMKQKTTFQKVPNLPTSSNLFLVGGRVGIQDPTPNSWNLRVYPRTMPGYHYPFNAGLLISSGAFFPWKSHHQCTCNQSGTSEASGSSFLAFANNKRIQVVRKKFENLLFCVVRWVFWNRVNV